MSSGFWNTTCNSTLEAMRIGSEEKLVGDFTFHALALVIAASTTAFACIMSFYLIWQHALNYTKPSEQRHIIRILFMVPIYAASSFLSLWFYWHAVYYSVISEAYEAFAIASFFALMCHLVAPDLHEQKQFFRQMQPITPWLPPVSWFAKCCGGQRGIWRTPGSGLTWFNITWIGVYQYCFIRVFMTIVAVVTEHFRKYCESSNSPVFAHVWVIGIEAVAVSIAMYCILQYYTQFRKSLAEHKLGMKVVAIKLVIFLSFWQTIAISLATSSTLHLVSANAKLAYPDIKVGIPSLLLCIEMAIFSLLHLWAFPYSPYKPSAKTTFYPSPSPSTGIPSRENEHGPKMGGFLGVKALVDALNVWDIVKAFGRGVRWLFVGAKHRREDTSYQLKSDTSYPIPGEANGKSTDQLPIAHQFRRSTYIQPNVSGEPVPDESAGLIANAQPNPALSQMGHADPYRDSHAESGPLRATSYTPYDERGDIGAVAPQYYAYHPEHADHADHAYETDSSETRVAPRAPGNARSSTQASFGNAFWGHDGPNQI
ncbi:organic solute transporter Ostalpha-domain-containing protein [Xylaria sp. CBS 124048]|nr:organic solute transporter Ostalpha-domain-containing protein [Xylaria sp. CBS 124048]